MEKKKKKSFPHPLWVIVLVVLAAVVLTWVIPSGEFAREKNEAGLDVVVVDQFTYLEKEYLKSWNIPSYIVSGFLKVSSMLFMTIFSGCAFTVVLESGALQSLIAAFVRKFGKKDIIFISVLTLIFGLIATSQSVVTFIGFTPIIVMMAISMGFDAILGVSLVVLGGAIGFSTGTLNATTTVIAQEIAGLPLYSGIVFRFVCFGVFMIVTDIFLVRYARRVKANPALSPMYELSRTEGFSIEGNADLDSMGKLDLRKILVIATVLGSLAVMVFGCLKLSWGMDQISMVFLCEGVIAGIVSGYSASKICELYTEGAKKMIGVCLIVGVSRAVGVVLDAAHVMDTIVYAMGTALSHVPAFLSAPAMFIANIIVNIFIGSGTGQATAVMPIFTPIADMVGMTRQTAVLAFNFGDGFCNYILPTASALMGNLAVANVPYTNWMKYMWKVFLMWVITGSALLIVAQIIQYGPM
ncbi:YfcC family protein [Hominifimenecus sp. rT4P-3]|uniref:YfcC family protein n=1 Tax=Hominifimenecus sp. rT4P-3 TaxID=3242979 RepID=UPI003DA4A0E1